MAIYYMIQHSDIIATEAAGSPGTGWALATDLQALLDTARTANLPLILQPGLYTTSTAVTISPGTGGGNSLELRAIPGTAIIRLTTSAEHLLEVRDVPDVSVAGITFDGGGHPLSGGASPIGLVRFTGPDSYNFTLRNCRILNSTQTGIVVNDRSQGRIIESILLNCRTGIFANDSLAIIEQNYLQGMLDNGVAVWTSAHAFNGSQVFGNQIEGVNNDSGGTGQYGNAVLIFRAGGVKVMNNTLRDTKYSAVRANGALDLQVIGNNCSDLREVAIFIEAPGAGLDLIGCVISDNVINRAGMGISVANAGLYNDGAAKRTIVSNNIVSNITRNAIPDPGYSHPVTSGIGMGSEIDSNITGNTIENVATIGIGLGTNDAAINLACTGNLIINAPMGIGYSANPDAESILISSNLIRGYREISDIDEPDYANSGAIVSYHFNGTNDVRDSSGGAANTDYGNSAHAVAGSVTIGMNRADT
ncbi:TIGR03808 family TAT-translocated repetitive protein [Pelagibacterium sp. 26DY04]|uniref:TIGR03808 family TAT-translocated repetitive protein n=1 Tax=Pelagibacterium sp. 26DY04 TaxID=2967130 RepID=UPI002814B4B3|nr:TIGR03808 family TAT-translocated repetitive protein [Pelagibacterium sp. 26DY04]WMT86187.1 TIGR03808 family TAT-translocated repetitive protein [Pelagibacterium sp. 26DY04]